MPEECRHILPSGKKCEANALKGTPLCYFHTNVRRLVKRRPGTMDSIEIPVLEDRCAIQLTIAQVLKHLVNQTIDNQRAAILLRGLQLASRNVGSEGVADAFPTVKDLSRTEEGDELAPPSGQ